MRITAAFLGAAILAGGGAMALVYGLRHGLFIALLMILMGLPVLTVSHLIARHRRRIGRLSWQIVVGVVVVLGLDLVGVQFIATMFLPPREAFYLALLLTFACMLVGFAAWRLISDVTRDIARVRDAVVAVRQGNREQEVEIGGGDDELSALASQVNYMARELEQREAERDASEQARSDLVAAVSHDLRTPLNSLRLTARAIEDDLADEQTLRRYLGQMTVNLESLDTLIEDLFELARIEAGDIAWPFEDLVLDELIDETVEGITPVADERGVGFRLSVSPELPRVRANPEKMQRVLFNLIQNALQHTPKGGQISVSATATDGLVEVRVIDTGPGIATGELDRVFEPLWRGGDARAARSSDGAGLGLPIARSIVEAHGGHIYIAGTSPRGTQICFTLPRVPSALADSDGGRPGSSSPRSA